MTSANKSLLTAHILNAYAGSSKLHPAYCVVVKSAIHHGWAVKTTMEYRSQVDGSLICSCYGLRRIEEYALG